MPMKYDKLWDLIEKRGLSQYKLLKSKTISATTMQKLREGKSVTTESISRPAISWNTSRVRNKPHKEAGKTGWFLPAFSSILFIYIRTTADQNASPNARIDG